MLDEEIALAEAINNLTVSSDLLLSSSAFAVTDNGSLSKLNPPTVFLVAREEFAVGVAGKELGGEVRGDDSAVPKKSGMVS